MLIDCALFSSEVDMLTLRMLTLSDVVDHLCVVACARTHQGEDADVTAISEAFGNATMRARPKSASLHWCDAAFDFPPGERGGVHSRFYQVVERAHRDSCLDAVREITTDPEAIVMVSDVDEIPDPLSVAMFPDLPFDATPWYTCEQRFVSTALTLLHPVQPWTGTTVSRLADCAPQEMRDARTTVYNDEPTITVIKDCGVHLSWCGTDAERGQKARTFSHAEHRGFDHVSARRNRQHVNGEQLTECEFPGDLWWPAPLLDGTFTPPASWLLSASG